MKGGKTTPVRARGDGTPLQKLEVGEWYQGEVSHIDDYQDHIFVDIGASYDALLNTPAHLGRRQGLQVGSPLPVEIVKMNARSGELRAERVGSPQSPAISNGPTLPAPDVWNGYPENAENKGKGKGKGKVRDAKGKGKHQESFLRTPLQELQTDIIVTGYVKRVNNFGVFFDIGAEADARLIAGHAKLNHFVVGDAVELRVDWVKTSLRRIQVSLLGDDLRPPESTKKPASSSARRNSRDSEFSNVKKGMFFDGVVKEVTSKSVLVDFGFAKKGRLSPAEELLSDFRVGDKIVGMEVSFVDHHLDELYFTLEDPFMTEDELSVPSGAHPTTRSTSASASRARSMQGADRSPQLASLVDGVVVRIASSIVYVDVGLETLAHLVAPPEVRRMFRNGDKIRGMEVEAIDNELGHLTLSVDDPTIEEPLKEPPSAAKQRDGRRAEKDSEWSSDADTRTEWTRRDRYSNASDRAQSRGRNQSRRTDWQVNRASYSRRSLDHPNAKPLKYFKVGDEVTGIVTRTQVNQIFLDFGAVVDGLVDLPEKDRCKFLVGDQVEGALIDSIHWDEMRVTLSIPWDLGEPSEIWQ